MNIRTLVGRIAKGGAGGLILAAAAFALATPAAAQVPPAGTTTITTSIIGEGCWKTSVQPDAAAVVAGRDPFTEYSTVDSTRVVMQQMSRLGYKQTALTATPGATQTTYTLTITNRDGGKVVITGTATATTNNGTAVWTTSDGKVYNYTYAGVPYTPAVDPES